VTRGECLLSGEWLRFIGLFLACSGTFFQLLESLIGVETSMELEFKRLSL
jgi:hypothetical protein